MRGLHESFSQSHEWYRKWHENEMAGIIHWVAVIAFAVVVGTGLTKIITGNSALEASVINSTVTAEISSDIRSSTNKFLQSLKKYQKAGEREKNAALSELTTIAAERQNLLINKSKNNPNDVILNALPADIISQIPSEISSLMEHDEAISGTLNVYYVDYPKGINREELHVVLEDQNSDKKYNLHFNASVPNLKTGDKIKAHGIAINNELVLELSNNQNTSSLQVTQTSALVSGQQKTLAILINFADNPSQPFQPSDVMNAIFNNPDSTNQFYTANSYGLTSFTGTAVGWYTIPNSSATCDTTGFASAAKSAAQNNGVNLSNYNRFVIVMPRIGACSWAGLSNVGGNPSNTWVNGYIDAFVYSHELGHALGMHHAATFNCGGAQIGPSCSLTEYGDPYDVMGGSWVTRNISAGHRYQMGWGNLQSVTGSGTYTVYPQEVANAGTQILKISKPDTGEAYYVEYRKAIGYDTGIPTSMENIGINLWGSTQTKRLDMSPDGDFTNSALGDNLSFVDTTNNITVKQISHDTTSAVVTVTMNTPVCNKVAPTVTISPTSQSVQAGNSVNYSVTVKNNDTASCANTSFNLGANIANSFNYSFAPTPVTISPGSTATSQTTLTAAAGTPDSSNAFAVSATDISDPAHTNSNSATVIVFTPVVDTVSPTATITAPSNGSTVSGNKVSVSADASDDTKLSKVELTIDDKIVKTCTTTTRTLSCVYSWNTKPYAKGLHTIGAKAYDTAGNVSPISNVSVSI